MSKQFHMIVIVLLSFVLTFSVVASALAEEGSQVEQTEPVTPTAEPQTPEPTPIPETPEPATAAPASTAPATVAPTEAPGTVDLHMYVYTTGNLPASGYTVQLGSARATTGSDGRANFNGLAVAQQSVTITSPTGEQCVGRLYMSRANATGVTDQAMGGTYGVDVARGQSELYMLVTFVPDDAMTIRTLSNSQPALPETPAVTSAAPASVSSAAFAGTRALTAIFLDSDSKPISGMPVQITADDGTTFENSTNASGEISSPQAPLGHYAVTVTPPGAASSLFDLTLQAGDRTTVVSNTDGSMVVSVNAEMNARRLYLQFMQAGDSFVLTEASDEPIGSNTNSMLIGLLIVAAGVVAIIVVVSILRRRRRSRTGSVKRGPQRHVNYVPGEEPRKGAAAAQPKRTGGANKFDDRSRL